MNSSYKYQPLFYFSMTFLATYVFWFNGAYLSFRHAGGLHMLLMLPGLMAPFLVSLLMVYASGRSDLKKDFLNRLINPRLIQPRMLPAFLLIMPLSVVASILLSLPFGGSASQLQFVPGFSFSSGFVPVLLLLVLAACFEELGWRGYAFDSLQSRYNYFWATMVFSVLWSLWHLPLLFVKGSYQYEIFHGNIWFGVNFFVGIVPMGVIISWICIKNGKSLIAAVSFHFMVNISQEILDISQATKCIETGVLAVVAAVIVALDRKLFFSKADLPGEAS